MPSRTGAKKFNRPACSDPVHIWLISGVNLRQVEANMIRLWIRVWEESPKETGIRQVSPAARRDPPVENSEAFFNLY